MWKYQIKPKENTEEGIVSVKYETSIFEDPSWHRNTAIRAEGAGGLAGIQMQRQSVVVNESKEFLLWWGSRDSFTDWSLGRGWCSFLIPHPEKSRLRTKLSPNAEGAVAHNQPQAGRQRWDITSWPRTESRFPRDPAWICHSPVVLQDGSFNCSY